MKIVASLRNDQLFSWCTCRRILRGNNLNGQKQRQALLSQADRICHGANAIESAVESKCAMPRVPGNAVARPSCPNMLHGTRWITGEIAHLSLPSMNRESALCKCKAPPRECQLPSVAVLFAMFRRHKWPPIINCLHFAKRWVAGIPACRDNRVVAPLARFLLRNLRRASMPK